jgi:DnaK suppressor protein
MALDETTKEELKEKLLATKSRLEGELGRIGRPTDVPGEYETKYEDFGSDKDDNATEVEQYVDNMGVEDSLEGQLAAVNGALARMEAGAYGTCSVCGKDIQEGRLMAYPAATECMEHAK